MGEIKVEFSPWRRPMNRRLLLASLIANYWLITKIGRKYLTQSAVHCVISAKEEASGDLGLMKSIKEEQGRKTLLAFIDGQLNHRMGLKGHRGYFIFIGHEPFKSMDR